MGRGQVSRCAAQRRRGTRRGNQFLDGDRYAVEGATRLTALPADLRRACLRQRRVRPQQIGRVDMRLPPLNVRQHRLGHLDRREGTLAVGGDQFRRTEIMPTHDQDMAATSFTKIGMSFQRPLRFLLATVIHCGWYKKACTASLASMRCASPNSLARSAARGAFWILSNRALNCGES